MGTTQTTVRTPLFIYSIYSIYSIDNQIFDESSKILNYIKVKLKMEANK